jgi:hypothetical protein
MTDHLADLAGVSSYQVRIEFTDRFEPSSLSGDGLPFVSVEDEIVANSATPAGEALRKAHGRVPYGAPLYLWEVATDKGSQVVYVGQTMKLTAQKRFEQHASVMKILADHVNTNGAYVYFRLCSRLDLIYQTGGQTLCRAIEHFPSAQACAVVDDLEAYIIFQIKPQYNTHYKNQAKAYQTLFTIAQTQNISLA